MSTEEATNRKQGSNIDRNEILRTVVADAESMGLRDRAKVESLTARVIEKLEGQNALPGMEELVTKRKKNKMRLPSGQEIQSMIEQILAEDQAMSRQAQPHIEEDVPMADTTIESEPKVETGGIILTENARQVLEKRYLKKDKKGKIIETTEEMFRRVARTIAAAETICDSKADVKAREDEFYRLMTNLEFLPNSPTLMNAGRELGQLSACFVLPVEDSMESIFDAVKNTALIHKSGGGTGFSFSRLRPEKDRVGSTGGVASGPVSFMRAFDTATDVIKQGGMRRGANMAILSVDHPDILKFIDAKKNDPNVLTNFNLSVAVTVNFMEAVRSGSDYDLINPHSGEAAGKLNAREVFNKIVSSAWKTGDPGIIFIDRINEKNPTPHLGKIESTNPCGEQPLLPYESCNLGSINLSRMLREKGAGYEIDYPRLGRVVKSAVRFLDNVIDVNHFPLPEIEKMTRSTRKIGLGVMGFADMLLQLEIPYNSEAAVDIAGDVMRFINEEALGISVELAAERGAFPTFKGSVYDTPGAPKVRNASRTTIAPTGTLSIIAGCSSGIEPLFALSFTRNILDGANMVEVNQYFEKAARDGGFYNEELMRQLATGTRLHEVEGIPDIIKQVFVTAHEIAPEWHVRMQAAFQKQTDNAVSKTVNFPKEATEDDVAKVYTLAYELGLKGITIYRDGSRESQPMSTKKEEKKSESTGPGRLSPRKRPKRTTAFVEKITTGCGSMYITVASDDKGLCEVFSTLGKAGGCASAQLEATCRLISLALRSGVDPSEVVKMLRGIRCPSIAWEDGKSVLSCADAIATVLDNYLKGLIEIPKVERNDRSNGYSETKEANEEPEDSAPVRNIAGQCPDCGGLLRYQEGCFICPACGYTKC
jgi:ribonucleoside-diphosphate reductase alpha chain